MPRFLDTTTGDFVWRDPGRAKKYAVLSGSHTWSSPEESYLYIRALQAQVSATIRTGKPPTPSPTPSEIKEIPSVLAHPHLPDKIKEICRIARKDGFRLLWIDACCMNLTSTPELAEILHLTYELFRQATICYVYLADVNTSPDTSELLSSFRRTRWFTRSWTLQELIAPPTLVFLNCYWQNVGTKATLASQLQEITGIPSAVSTDASSLMTFGVAQRMSWAAHRETTFLEDKAYSLMGMFGVRVSPNYGEGFRAFRHLQKEILRVVRDHTIFAWGPSCTVSLSDTAISIRGTDGASHEYHPNLLLAHSPLDFAGCSDLLPLSSTEFARLAGVNAWNTQCPTSVVVDKTLRLDLLLVDVCRIPLLATALHDLCGGVDSDDHTSSDCGGHPHAQALALLHCQDNVGNLVALPLCPSQRDSGVWHHPLIATHLLQPNPPRTTVHSGGPYRIVRLSLEVLKLGMQQAPPTVVPVEFPISAKCHLLGQAWASPASPPFISPPVTEQHFLPDNCLTFHIEDLDHTPEAVLSIDPTDQSVAYMRVLKFTSSPLQVKHSERGVHVCAALVSDFPHQSGVTSGHHLYLDITLTKPASPDSTQRTAKFSVTNYIHTAPSPSSSARVGDGPPRNGFQDGSHSDDHSSPPRSRVMVAPTVDESDLPLALGVESSENDVTSTRSVTLDWTPLRDDETWRVLAEVRFRVYADASWELAARPSPTDRLSAPTNRHPSFGASGTTWGLRSRTRMWFWPG
ncbi:hypothetical protein C8Q77DRAFT_721212 [Trametes polyzona]|nr:hypothetical protein C8Q77DRAFT_721212 [Trametes polyzona]